MIYEHFSFIKHLFPEGAWSTGTLWKVASVINCDYGEKISLTEKILFSPRFWLFFQILFLIFCQTEKVILTHAYHL